MSDLMEHIHRQPNHAPCPNHLGQWQSKSTGDCSCGSNHNRWASSNNPGGMTTAHDHRMTRTLTAGAREHCSVAWVLDVRQHGIEVANRRAIRRAHLIAHLFGLNPEALT